MHIHIAEDNFDHAELLIETLKDLCPAIRVTHSNNGEDAIKFLEGLASAAAKLPDMVLLDIKMPRMNGIEALTALKRHNQLKNIPVAMLSTSTNQTEIELCLNKGATTYISKPMLAQDFEDKIRPQIMRDIR